MQANLNEEKKLWRQGYEFVVGLDEAGRGPLAGPVVACAVMLNSLNLPQKHFNTQLNVKMFLGINDSKKQTHKLKFVSLFKGLKDSKKLSEKQREFFYETLTHHENITWGIGMVSEKVIDKINILEATKLAMKKAVDNVQAKIYSSFPQKAGIDFLLIDGNFVLHKVNIPQKSIIKGDQKVFSIAAAGIIAKVTRDRIMRKIHKKHPNYGFDRHKGYGTRFHVAKLAEIGFCGAHRKSFYPVNALVKRETV